MTGDKYIRIKVREGEHEVLGPFGTDELAKAELRKRPRAHLAKDASIEAELMTVTADLELTKDGILKVAVTE